MDVAWLHGGRGLVGTGRAAVIDPGTGGQRFARAAADLAGALPQTASQVAFASFTFDEEAEGSSVVVPEVVHAWAPDGVPAAEGRVRYAGSTLPDARWLEAVAQAVEMIAAGGLGKVVLARDRLVWAKRPFDAGALAARLAALFPTCFVFVHDGLVGATPELLVRRRGREVTSVAVAGTAGRRADAAEDAAAGRALLASVKERAEHRYTVASVRDALGGICDRLRADPDPQLLLLDNVQHLATTVRGVLREPLTALEVAGMLHPTAAVCGTPREDALAAIRGLEGMDRGRYAGPVGWVDAAGDGEFGIALRCAQLDGARARMFAGAGVVAGSLPEAELEETRLKLRAMESAFGDG